jgi:putative selenate reductase FAD-binding subunit
MIKQYYRPKTMQEALILLSQPNTIPLGGGTILSQRRKEDFSVIDLQALDLNTIHKSGNTLEIGATVTLQTLFESAYTPEALKTAIKLETPLNIRTKGTVAGTLITCTGRSSFGTVMLALDADCSLAGEDPQTFRIGNLLPIRNEFFHGTLITKIKIPLITKLGFETIARTPDDKPIICAGLAQWPSGRTRLALGGWGFTPILAMDGNEAGGAEDAARNATSEATDEWASAEYRQEMSALLAKRCLASLE